MLHGKIKPFVREQGPAIRHANTEAASVRPHQQGWRLGRPSCSLWHHRHCSEMLRHSQNQPFPARPARRPSARRHQASPDWAGLPCLPSGVFGFAPSSSDLSEKQTGGRRQGRHARLLPLRAMKENPGQEAACSRASFRVRIGEKKTAREERGTKGGAGEGGRPLLFHLLADARRPRRNAARAHPGLDGAPPPSGQAGEPRRLHQAKAAVSCTEFAQCRKQSEKQKSGLREALLLSGPRRKGNRRHRGASGAAGCGSRTLVVRQGSWSHSRRLCYISFPETYPWESLLSLRGEGAALLQAGSKELGHACPGGGHAPGRTSDLTSEELPWVPLFLEPLGSASPRPPGMLACGGEPPREARLLLRGELGGGRDGIREEFRSWFFPEGSNPSCPTRLGPIYRRLIHSKGPQISP